MNNGTDDHVNDEKSPLVVEILGPAGSGKTTILNALSRRDTKIRPDFPLSRTEKIPYLISNTFTLLPTYLRQYRNTRWFDRREIRSMVYLKAGLHVLGQQVSNNGRVTVLDHGPIYRLAFLREFGPEITNSQSYKLWWESLFKEWVTTLDIVIWLDAPNDILWKRIRARDRWHMIKDKCEHEAFEFLTRYRASFEQTIAESRIYCQIKLLRFDTSQESVERTSEKILAALDAG
jgi:cytidylate kinase